MSLELLSDWAERMPQQPYSLKEEGYMLQIVFLHPIKQSISANA